MATRSYTELTLKRLYGRAGNLCAFPNCPFELIYEQGNLSDICHIEALNPGGSRFNIDPNVDNKDRNDYPNLVLFCKNHHHMIDQKDAGGNPFYSTEQLKTIKQTHEDFFSEAKESLFRTKAPSLLAKIIKKLSESEEDPAPPKRPLPFTVEAKISYNAIERNYALIEKYSVYSMIVDCIYNEFEAGPMKKVLNVINDCYLINQRPNQSADDTLDRVQTTLIQRLNTEGFLGYSEDLESCVKIIMVDAFMRCKILEAPPQ